MNSPAIYQMTTLVIISSEQINFPLCHDILMVGLWPLHFGLFVIWECLVPCNVFLCILDLYLINVTGIFSTRLDNGKVLLDRTKPPLRQSHPWQRVCVLHYFVCSVVFFITDNEDFFITDNEIFQFPDMYVS